MMAIRNIIEGMSLRDLLQGIADVTPDNECMITGISDDSRNVKAGDVFIACTGANTSGMNYIHEAIARGAVAVLAEYIPDVINGKISVPIIPVEDLRNQTGRIASRYFGEPSRHMNVIGITGTNGKTSVACFLCQVMSRQGGVPVGYIGTLGLGIFDNLATTKNTTPDPITLQRTLAELREQGVKNVVMEVSSHALDQGRIAGTDIDIGVFTGLSRDHLDYHGDMDSYAGAKKKLFLTESLNYGIINSDDMYGRELIESLRDGITVISYGVSGGTSNENEIPAQVSAAIEKQELGSITIRVTSPWGSGNLTSPLTGIFNVYNLLAVLAVLCLSGTSFKSALNYLSALHNIPGRMETFGNPDSANVIVDYSHTPDALKQALLVLRDQCRGKLICVFGCGGDRDQGKRPEMGHIAGEYADHIILTNDNPRNEPPETIIQDILQGIPATASVQIESDRARAIELAIEMAVPEDIILVAGKGHETYQEVAGKRYPFSDRQLVKNLLEKKS